MWLTIILWKMSLNRGQAQLRGQYVAGSPAHTGHGRPTAAADDDDDDDCEREMDGQCDVSKSAVPARSVAVRAYRGRHANIFGWAKFAAHDRRSTSDLCRGGLVTLRPYRLQIFHGPLPTLPFTFHFPPFLSSLELDP